MCTCDADYTCWTHKTEAERAREDRLVSMYARARMAVDAAVRTLAKPTPHDAGQVRVLEKAVEGVQDYLTELRQR